MKSRKSYFDKEEHIDFGSGRVERRNCYICQELLFLDDLDGWKDIKSVIMTVRRSDRREKKWNY